MCTFALQNISYEIHPADAAVFVYFLQTVGLSITNVRQGTNQ